MTETYYDKLTRTAREMQAARDAVTAAHEAAVAVAYEIVTAKCKAEGIGFRRADGGKTVAERKSSAHGMVTFQVIDPRVGVHPEFEAAVARYVEARTAAEAAEAAYVAARAR